MSNDTHHPICPKCGYDQSGEIATWQSQCPIRGTCPECGLMFEWADVFDPGRVRLAWYTEHADHKRAMIRLTIPTLWMLLIPNRFWKRVSVERTVFPIRVWVWCFGMLLFAYVLSVFASVGVSSYQTYKWNTLSATNTDMSGFDFWYERFLEAFTNLITNSDGLTQNGMQFSMLGAGMIVTWAAILCGVPITRRIAKIRLSHVSRAIALSVTVVIMSFVLTLLIDCMSSILTTAGLALSQTKMGNVVVASSIRQVRFRQVEYYANLSVTILFAAMVIWVQWFWIAAIVVGWRIRSIVLQILGIIASLLAGYTVFMYILVY